MNADLLGLLDPDEAGEGVRRMLDQRADADGRIALSPDTVEQDLARLVLGLVAFLRRLMELQAIRRMEAGSLTEDEEEALGLTLMRAETALADIAARFGLTPEDLVLDLGPLGRSI